MKKLIILCSAVLGSLLFCGCLPSSAPYEDFYSRSFVLRYCQVSDISIERRYYSEDDPDYNLGYFIRVVSDKLYRANRNGEEKQVYDALCEKYNDVTYNRKVRYSYDEYYPPRCSCFFTDMEIWSTADWDAGHPAGTPLDDIVRFKSDTPWVPLWAPPGLISGAVIRSGIPTRKGANTIRSIAWFRNLRRTT